MEGQYCQTRGGQGRRDRQNTQLSAGPGRAGGYRSVSQRRQLCLVAAPAAVVV